jgi:CubicO group peptidase (beta-lactamase class C family)
MGLDAGLIASMTKAITSAAAMQLVEQSRLELDTPAAKWAPELGQIQVLNGFDAGGQPRLRLRSPDPAIPDTLGDDDQVQPFRGQRRLVRIQDIDHHFEGGLPLAWAPFNDVQQREAIGTDGGSQLSFAPAVYALTNHAAERL